MIKMPGNSWSGPLPPLTENEEESLARLRGHVEHLAVKIGERSLSRYDNLRAAAEYINGAFAACGYEAKLQSYYAAHKLCHNIEVELTGSARPAEIVVVGGHYDSVPGCPGANDNATGTAAVLELARLFAGKPCARTVRFVAFVNEEPPHFQEETMGSLVYARGCKKRAERIVAMLSLETLGCYSDSKGSQAYPFPLSLFSPSTGNFIGFVGNTSSRGLVHATIASFREHAHFPSEGAVLTEYLPGVGWSDHWSFWQEGYPAAMITDTAPFRYAYYHTAKDTPDKIIYDRFARVVAGLAPMLADLAAGKE